ncbi:uncharacterized protein LOC135929013 isoform X2 [Gordionus sp. m RMFG-2023]|uniref:uncharacterized protein LOC135929013 isoform X2 n=1 Tax=Gordionus sp. m RMFG-2023 TaxID=3053472 RepID=UPI0031FBDFC1
MRSSFLGLIILLTFATNYGLGFIFGVPIIGRKLLQDCLLSGGRDNIYLNEEIPQSLPRIYMHKLPTDVQFFSVRKPTTESVCSFEMLFHLPPLYVIGVRIPTTTTIISTSNLTVEYDKDGLTIVVRRELPDVGIYRRFRFNVRNLANSAILNIDFEISDKVI